MSEKKNSSSISTLKGEASLYRFAPVLIHLYLILLLVLVGVSTYYAFLGNDVWFHIKNGEYILTHKSIPHADPFLSSTSKLPPWYFTNYEWLFGIITFKIFQVFSFKGLYVFRLILLSLTFLFLIWASNRKAFKDCREKYLPLQSILISLYVTAAAFFMVQYRVTLRSFLVSALCYAVFLFLIEDEFNWRHYTAFFLVSLLWANSHIEIMVGIIFVGLYLARALLKAFVNRKDSKALEEGKKRIKGLLIVLGIVFLALIISPPAKGIIKQSLSYYNFDNQYNQYLEIIELIPLKISDMWNLPLMAPMGIFYLVAIGSFIAVIPFKKERLYDLVIFIPFAVLPFINRRHVVPAAIVLTPIVAANLSLLAGILMRKKRVVERPLTISLLILFPLLWFTLWQGPSRLMSYYGRWKQGRDNEMFSTYNPSSLFPYEALNFIEDKGLKGAVFCPYDWGNFIIYYDKKGPADNRKPLVDGMMQTYPPVLLNDYVSIIHKADRREELIDKYEVGLFVLSYQNWFEPLSRYLEDSPEWNLVYWDDVSVVYTRKERITSEVTLYNFVHPLLFNSNPIPPWPLPYPDKSINDVKRSLEGPNGEKVIKTKLWLGNLYFTLKDYEKAKEAYEELIKMTASPADGRSIYYFHLALTYLQSGDAESAKKALEGCPGGYGPAIELKKKLAL